MTKKQAELLKRLNEKKQEVRELMKNEKIEEANELMSEVRRLSNELNNEIELDNINNDLEGRNGIQISKTGTEKRTEYNGELFYRALTGQSITEEERKLVKEVQTRALSETGDPKDGGNVVPDDISKEIHESIKEDESVRNLVKVENVKSKTGTRIFKNGTPNKLYNTAEREEIKELNNMQYDTLVYNIQKYAGIMDISTELLDDSFVNFKDEIVSWLSDSSRVTENEQILYGKGDDKNPEGIISSKGKYKELKAPSEINIPFLRKIKNTIKSGYRKNATWVLNTEVHEVLSNIEDKTGNSILAKDPRTEDQYTLFGRPVIIFDSILTDEKTGKTEILFGDLSRAYKMFLRKNFEIKMTDVGAGAFETDTIKARGIERFDGKIMDTEALVIVRDFDVKKVEPTTKP